ncbi:hypothetical protein NQ317_011698 [Molorchus minor]|uniref:Uncharacterized protein n=1 Tax=Molorchus minor TaxID=1323400 RepID=A0ABQ9JRT7_9CUCU|nr:hypothetical protein NQ317_011698 [Molorchus minor]
MTIYYVGEFVDKAYPKAFSSQNIQSGFRVSGAENERLISTVDSGKHLTPDQLRPLPKAPARKSGRGSRKPGRFLTDTPKKQENEETLSVKRKLTVNSSDDEELVSDSYSLEDIEWEKNETENEELNDKLEVGDFILVKLPTKKWLNILNAHNSVNVIVMRYIVDHASSVARLLKVVMVYSENQKLSVRVHVKFSFTKLAHKAICIFLDYKIVYIYNQKSLCFLLKVVFSEFQPNIEGALTENAENIRAVQAGVEPVR